MRLYDAEQMWLGDGHEPRPFHLMHLGGMQRTLDYPTWNPSWATPTRHDVDDLVEARCIRLDSPPTGNNRSFVFTLRGREEAKALAKRPPIRAGGRAPGAQEILAWLVGVHAEAPENFAQPAELIDRAVDEHFIDPAGREVFSRRVLALIADGYLSGKVPGLDQTTAEQELARTIDLDLTIQATEQHREERSINVYGSVVNSQVAGGNITQYTVITQLLDRAYEAVDALDVDADAKQEAKGLLDVLRGKATAAAGTIVTSTSAALVTDVLAKLIGLAPH
jgi:hypothetical protein